MKVYLDMVGCRLNQSEIESYAQKFLARGHTLTGDPAQADLAIVNTCTVTVAAAADSRKKIRRFARQGAKEIIATGCWATLEPQKARTLNKRTRVVPNDEKDHLVSKVLGAAPEVFDREPLEREMIPGARERTRAFIKAQDGCDHRCSYCITTIARGQSRSVPLPGVLKQVRAAQRGGAQEVVLTGVQLGSWGKDLEGDLGLQDLLEAILEETDVPRIRISSLEPWDVRGPLLERILEERVANQLHLPLQSGSADTLKRMARGITPAQYKALIDRIREMDPEIAITTDIMVGFPGETEDEFAESLTFVKEMRFADAHVFTYSAREGTRAANMPAQVDHQVRKERNALMREAAAQASRDYRSSFLGRQKRVLWESAASLDQESWEMRGLTANYLRVEAIAERNLWNQITPVKLTSLTDRGLKGEIQT
ncbi:MAG: tRNA (N(6)-L-threonylcarbamoyladenosine(37)-C(2))-methylthiotransferase MtaB [Anaerolineales bacterium]